MKIAVAAAVLALLGCERSSRKPPNQLPVHAADAAVARPPTTHIEGALTYEGKPYPLDGKLDISATHCREPEHHGVAVIIAIPADASPYQGIPLKLIEIDGDARLVPLGKPLEVATKANYGPYPERDDRARMLAWVSPSGRVGSSEVPISAKLRFDQLTREGAIDVTFELDYGSLGHASGRVILPASEQTVCVIPSPPQPPG